MTKVELEDFVREVFASFNQTLYESDREVILRAWWGLLQDLEIALVRDRFIQMDVDLVTHLEVRVIFQLL